MYDFIAIDFETANENLNSACSVGISVVEKLEIVDYFESYIQPPYNRYSDANIKVHGITPDMTERAPTLDDLWFDLSRYFSDHIPVVAHNAHFDMSVLRLSTTSKIPNFVYVDTISMVTPFVKGSRSLDHCAECFGIEMDQHHDALSDATTAAELAICVIKKSGFASMWEYLALNTDIRLHRFEELQPQKNFNRRKRQKPSNSEFHKFHKYTNPSDIIPTTEVDEMNPLFQKTIVFTGELSISRNDAYQIAKNCGAIIRTSVSRRTDYLVVGTQDISLVGTDGLSTKQEAAIELNNNGKAHIQVLNEKEFMTLASGGKLNYGADVIVVDTRGKSI